MQVYTYPEAQNYILYNTFEHPVIALNLYGNSVQDGTPTPDTPIDIVSVGDDGNVEITACGKNLIEGSQDFSGTWIYPWATSEETYQNLVVKEHTGAWNGTAKKVYIKEGKTYTFSAYVKQSGNDTITLYTIPSQSMNIANGADVSKHSLPISVTTEWQRFTHTFTCIKSGYATPRFESSTSSTTVYICGFQLEENNEMTEYEPYKSTTATITSGLPLCSIGDVRDELIYNADGTEKIIKRTGIITFDGSADENWETESGNRRINSKNWRNVIKPAMSNNSKVQGLCDKLPIGTATTTWNKEQGVAVDAYSNVFICIEELAGQDATAYKNWLASNPITFITELATPQEIELTAAEITALMKLQTFDRVTNIYNDEGAEMKITFLGGNEMQTNIDGFWDSEDGDKKYSAADFVGFFQDFFTNGIVAESTTYLQVLKKSGFEVAVNVGKAYINGCFFKPKTITTLALDVNDGTADRTDLIVIRWDKPLRQIYLAVKKGTTQLTRNELVYELGIAKIAVKANATEITQSDIADLRFDNAYCGVVTGVIDTIDTTNLFAQYEAEWNNFVAQLGESDHVTINVADEQARADLAAYVVKTDATLATNAPFKILKGTVTTTTSGVTEVKFSKSFASTPTVICAVVKDDSTTAVAYTAFMTLVNANLFRVYAKKLDSGIPSNWSVTVHWIAFGT